MKYKEVLSNLQILTNENITQTKLAAILNYSVQTINKRALRNSNFTSAELQTLEEYFNVNLPINNKQVSDDDIIEIEQIQGIQPACGGGLEVYTAPNIEPFRISRQAIIQYLRCTAPENLKIFEASGDSMEDKISDGDWLLVDIGRRDASISGIYVFTANGLWRCKRLNITLNGVLEVKSDNPKYGTETVKPNDNTEIVIIGRVLNNLSKGI